MSGLEAVGIAANLGTKLSVKLFSFYRQIQNANQAIQHLSSDVALTCAILRKLGDSLKQDETSKLCSPEGHLTAQQMLKQCEQVLLQIQTMIDESHAFGKSRWQQATSKLRNVLNEPDVNLVKPQHVETTNLNPTVCLASLSQTAEPAISSQKNSSNPANQEVQDYNSLIKAMLREIDGCKSKLEKSRHSRIRDGVLNVHSTEIVHFQRNYGPSIFQCFEDSIFDDSIVSQPVATGDLPNISLRPPAMSPRDLPKRIVDDGDNISQDTLLRSKSNYEHIIDGSLVPGISYPTSQKQASLGVNTSKKEKEIGRMFNNTFILEMTVGYMKKFQLSLKGSDTSVETSVETNVPAKLRSEHDQLEISKQGPRNRVIAALKEIESLIPSEFVQARLVKDKAISGVNPKSNAEDDPMARGRSKATIVEMAVDYIREMQQNLV
ncbi:uncharacterized protein N7496_002904 [Penicillium cataractarum]|uniref:BHLH domain-containing protein n=1 Tax=Penicillium cataractarum TaxID=2100454 RepID=A0A9W9SKZ0_9EURO|nr:uncharacterized protein N7496_002904 [Penicillium cataractarum]KAJ5380476.1 hypothetical protein N7496_002904 [Penicillium cataractarum]